ncbi:MAG: T9SS type A sorting domain-containing protein [Bacteroidetes bacterium]|nr:T9SS type A sorting domain-containing protein [Bacteroidota bacterium]
MIKKLLSASLVVAGILSLNAQELIKSSGIKEMASEPISRSSTVGQNKIAVASIQDTLYYFQRKNYYRNVNGNSYYTYRSPYQTSAVTLTEFGDSFLNGTTPTNGTPVTVTGAYILISRYAASTSTAVPIMVYIYSANLTGVPVAKLDSVTAMVTSTAGIYVNATFTAPVTVNGAFHISFKPMPVNADTVLIWYNNAATPSSTLPANQRYGEGLSYLRSSITSGSYTTTTNTFGAGTDREVIILPTVSFNYTASAVVSTPNATMSPGAYCSFSPISYTNTSGNVSVIENRQFNYNKFRPYWAPYTATVTIPAADSIYNWSFGGVAPLGVYTTKNASHTYTGTGTASSNLTVKYQKQTNVKLTDIKTSTMSVVSCGPVSVKENNVSGYSLSVYPNPTVNGKTNVGGLEGTNLITVYNMLGQVIHTQTSDKELVTIDLSGQMSGNYLVRITNSNNQTKTVKIINQ